MGFDGNGNWTSDFYPINDRDNSVPILASKFQKLIQENLKQSFENCILRDGTGRPTANINFNGQKITNLADGTNAADAATKGQLDTAMDTNATDTTKGTVRLATSLEALAGTDNETAMTPATVKEVINSLASTTPFCVNSGYTTSGKPDLLAGLTTGTLSFNVDDGTSYAPLVATTASGESFYAESITSLDVSGFTDGTYNVFVNNDGTAYAYANVIYRQQTQPASMNTNDIWFNTCEPYKAYIKTAGGLEETDFVQLPQLVTITSNVISSIDTIAYFNDNGAEQAISSNYEAIKNGLDVDWTSGVSIPKPYGVGNEFTAPSDGLCTFLLMNRNGSVTIYVNGNSTGLTTTHSNVDLDNATMSVYVRKGDIVAISNSSADTYGGTFFPLKGVI